MKDNFINDIVQEIKEKGYSRVENFISPEVSQKIEKFMHKFNEENYNQENLLKRICFKREEGKNRQGDAYMVSIEKNSLGSIQLDEDDIDDGVVGDIFKIYNSILEKFVGKKMDDNSRAMLNCQQYFAEEIILESSDVLEYLMNSGLNFDEQEIINFIK